MEGQREKKKKYNGSGYPLRVGAAQDELFGGLGRAKGLHPHRRPPRRLALPGSPPAAAAAGAGGRAPPSEARVLENLSKKK